MGRGKLKNYYFFLSLILIFQSNLGAQQQVTNPIDAENYLNAPYEVTNQQNTPPPPQPNTSDQQPIASVNTWDFLTMIIALLFVVGIIYLVYWLLKRGFGKKIVENEQIKILGSRIITGNKVLHLIEVGGLIYLIASANEAVNLIAEITDKEAKDLIKVQTAEAINLKPTRFKDLLGTLFKPKLKDQLKINESVEFIKEQRDRLNKMKE